MHAFTLIARSRGPTIVVEPPGNVCEPSTVGASFVRVARLNPDRLLAFGFLNYTSAGSHKPTRRNNSIVNLDLRRSHRTYGSLVHLVWREHGERLSLEVIFVSASR